MKKKLLGLLLATVMAASCFAGCGNKGGGGSTTPTATPTKDDSGLTTDNISLKVWESAKGPDDFIKKAGEAFTKLHPNIKIEYVNVELGDSTSKIALDGPAGVGADVFAAPHDKLGELVEGGHVLATVNSSDVQKAALPSCVKALTYKNKMYGYPVSAETYALFYNKALISEDKVPKTWEDLKAWAVDFNSKNSGKYGFVMDVGNAYYTILFTTSQNNRLFGESGTDSEKTNINSEASIKGMKFFQSLKDALNYPAADLTTSFCDGAFQAGTAAMHITGLWNVQNFKTAGIDFGVTTLPSLPGESNPASSFSGTRAMFVSAYSKYPKEAAAFAQFLTTDEMQKLRFSITGAVPSINVKVESPYIEGFSKQLGYAFPMPSIPAMSKYWDSMNAASANIWGGKDVKTELDAVDAALKAK